MKKARKSASTTSIFQRTAQLTAVSERALYKWSTEFQKSGRVSTPQTRSTGGKNCERAKKLDDFDLGVLRRKVHDFFRRSEMPTVEKVRKLFNESDDLPQVSVSTLNRMLKKLGFKYRKRSRNAHLIEGPNIIQWRCSYLRQIKEFRKEGRRYILRTKPGQTLGTRKIVCG